MKKRPTTNDHLPVELEPQQQHTGQNPLRHWPRPLAFVLSGGGAYGATQVGMIKALNRAGVDPDLVVGTSVGALNGSMLAANPALAVDRLTKIWISLDGTGAFGKSRFSTALAMFRNVLKVHNPAVLAPDDLKTLINSTMPVERIEELSIPTGIVVTDALLGLPKILAQGPIAPALLASAAIPGVFPPVGIDGCVYVDGGVTANVPIRQAIAFGAKSVIVLDANPGTMPGTLPISAPQAVMHASMIMLRNQRADIIDDLVGKYPILKLPPSTPPTQNSFDFTNSTELIDAGYRTARDFLRELPALTDTAPKKSAADTPPPPIPPTVSPEPTIDQDAPQSRISL